MDVKKRLWFALGLIFIFLATGSAGYVILEDYPPLDAFYMAVITLSTVGFGEIYPLSEAGKTFTIFLILSGVGGLAFAAGSITELLLERATDPNFWKRPMEKKIAKLEGHTIICGGGRVGSSAAHELQKAHLPFVVIESADNHLASHEREGLLLLGDATRESVLLKAGIKKATSLLALLNSDPENLFTVLTARELNPTLRIIARTEDPSSEKRILRAGADSVISLFVSAGKRVARNVMAEPGEKLINEEDHSQVRPTWLTPSKNAPYLNTTISDVQEHLKCNIVGIRKDGQDSLMPDPDTLVEDGDSLLLLDQSAHASLINECNNCNQKKIVLIDDNPVICTLYTRLFQKAGFHVSTAQNGLDGIILAKEITPDVIIIDFHLPDIDGIEVCKEIRTTNGFDADTKIFLFTGDDETKVAKLALEAGVDQVVVKSPEASEIVGKVQATLD